MTDQSGSGWTFRTSIVAVSTAMLALGSLAMAALNVQSPAASAPPAFETSVVTKNTSGLPPNGTIYLATRGYFTAANVTLRRLIQAAYQHHALDQIAIEGGPEWLDSERFNIDAQAGAEHSLDSDGIPRQTRLMLRTLLAERFKLKARTESREAPIYALVFATSDAAPGPRLRKSAVDCVEAVTLMIAGKRPKASCGFQQYVGRSVQSVLTLPDVAAVFSDLVDRPVIDRTRLAGHFEVSLDGVEVRPPGPFDPGYRPSDTKQALFAAMPGQLGLRLEPTIGSVEVLVVEHAEDPTRRGTLPLVVEHAEVVPGDPSGRRFDHVSVRVHNTGTRTIVAWGVITELRFDDGKDRRGGVSTDGLESRGLDVRNSRVVLPDARDTIAFGGLPNSREAKDVASITADVDFVVFDDDTALGDDRKVSHVFARRAASQRAWSVIEKAFSDAMARTADPLEAILAADKSLEAITDTEIRNGVAYMHIRRNIALTLKYKGDAGAFLERTIAEVRARQEAVEGHLQRRR